MALALILAALVAGGRAGAEPAGAEIAKPPKTAELEESWLIPSGHALSVMTGMRLSEALLWPKPFAETDTSFWADSYRDAYTSPPRWDSSAAPFEWDGDRWQLNVVGHGLFGSELYFRPRLCRKSPLASLAFAALGSATWEYVFEANAVQPSGLDLWYTPLAGAVLGEARYLIWHGASGISDPTLRGVVRAVIDPFGELERSVFGFGC